MSRAAVDRALISHSHSAIPIRQSGRARIAIHHQSATEQSRRRAPIARHRNRRRFYEFQQRRLPQRTPRLHQQRRRPPRLLLRTPVADAVRRPRRPQIDEASLPQSPSQTHNGTATGDAATPPTRPAGFSDTADQESKTHPLRHSGHDAVSWPHSSSITSPKISQGGCISIRLFD